MATKYECPNDLFKPKREFLNGVVIQTIITPEEKK